MDWRHFTAWVIGAALAFGAALYVFILVMDPYMNVPFSPDLPRAPVSTNQRFAYPALARAPRFDSAIVGTSTVRLLDPARLSDLLGARFVSLAMNSATAYEQARILEVFLRAHPAPRYLVFGIDETWCNRASDVPRYTFRDFPEWMYDQSAWNDLLYLFNDKALENAVRMAELLAGRREPKYRRDGFRDFSEDFARFDAKTIERRLYPGARHALSDRLIEPTAARPGWNFVLMGRLREMLAAVPDGAQSLLLLPPLHANHVAGRIEALAECKSRVVGVADAFDNARVLDYLHISALTRTDARYFDPVHFDREVAALVEAGIAGALKGEDAPPRYARLPGQGADR